MNSLSIDLKKQSDELWSTQPPSLGHPVRSLFGFDKDYINFNNGSYGACPTYVMNVVERYQKEAERRPDPFFRKTYQPLLTEAQRQVASLVHCDSQDLVLIPNTTTGVNAILRGLNGSWQPKDAILVYQTIYGACGKSAQYIVDTNRSFQLTLVTVPISYPLSHEEFLQITEKTIINAQSQGIRIRIAVVDAISSVPGALVPWQSVVQLLKKHHILSLIDGAHAVGQIHLDLTSSDPDFFISNCHKWLNARRGVAFLYVPKRNQSIAQSLPTSHEYQSPGSSFPPSSDSNFVTRWQWTGTQDFSHYLAVPAAIEFRRWLGGESAILEYTHRLACRGGQIVANILGHGSTVLDFAHQQFPLTAAMKNVSIPVANPCQELALQLTWKLADSNPTYVPFFFHAGKIWIRISAQIWLDESDFKWLGNRIKALLLENPSLLPVPRSSL